MSNLDKKKQNRFIAFIDNHRHDIDFILGSGMDAMNATVFSHLTTTNLAKFLLEGVLKMIAFPIVFFLATVDWIWSITKAVRDWKKGQHGITATVVHAVVMSIAYPLIAAAITLSFLFTTALTPIFFVAAFALLTLEAWGSAIYHTYKALKAEKGSPERKQHATQAKFLFAFAVIASVLTAMVGVVMIKIAPLISATYAGIGVGASVCGFIAKCALWMHLRKQQEKTEVSKEAAEKKPLLSTDPLTGRPQAQSVVEPDPHNRSEKTEASKEAAEKNPLLNTDPLTGRLQAQSVVEPDPHNRSGLHFFPRFDKEAEETSQTGFVSTPTLK